MVAGHGAGRAADRAAGPVAHGRRPCPPRFCPARAAAQTFNATSISQAAQDARRDVGRLARRADNLLRLTVADGAERGAVAVRRFRAEQVGLARELAAVFNSRVSEDDWLLIVPTAELDLVLAMRPLVIRIAPTADEVEAAIKQPLPQVEPLIGDTASDVLLTIVLDALGLDPRRRHVRAAARRPHARPRPAGRRRRRQGAALWPRRARARTGDAGDGAAGNRRRRSPTISGRTPRARSTSR